jgi:hypothetical protein
MQGVRDLDLCGNVGEPTGSDEIVQVDSWDQSLSSCRSDTWRTFLSDRDEDFWKLGRLGFRMIAVPTIRVEFDRLRGEAEREIYPIIDEKAASLPLSPKDQQVVSRAIGHYLVGAVMFIRYQDQTDAIFNLLTSGWILNGHFPCGWQGGFPDGKLVVY